MTVTERLMKPGQWSLKLKQAAQYKLWQQCRMFDHIVITPTRVDPNALSDATILGSAIYTGVILSEPTAFGLSGQGLAYWLGSDQGLGDLNGGAGWSLSAAVLSTWVNTLRPSSIGAGTVTSPGATLTHTFGASTRREALDYVCRMLGAEWRINPNCTLDAAISSNLFVTTPTAVISKRGEGKDGTYVGLEATQLNMLTDVEGYTTKIIAFGTKGDGAATPTGTASQATSYKDFNNNSVVWERLANAPDTSAANLSTAATNALAYYGTVRRQAAISTRSFAIGTKVEVGDWVYVYDPSTGFQDTSNQITYRGRLIQPIKLRVWEYTWPIMRGMGVYVRQSGATPTYIDLTTQVEYETMDTTWQVGFSDADPSQDPTQLSSAYLGINPTVINRVIDPPLNTWTPTTTNVTLGTSTLTATYRIVQGTLVFNIAISAGSATATAAGDIRFSLPAGLSMLAQIQPVTAELASNTLVTARYDAGTNLIRVWATNAAANFTLGQAIASTTIQGHLLFSS